MKVGNYIISWNHGISVTPAPTTTTTTSTTSSIASTAFSTSTTSSIPSITSAVSSTSTTSSIASTAFSTSTTSSIPSIPSITSAASSTSTTSTSPSTSTTPVLTAKTLDMIKNIKELLTDGGSLEISRFDYMGRCEYEKIEGGKLVDNDTILEGIRLGCNKGKVRIKVSDIQDARLFDPWDSSIGDYYDR